MKSSLEAKISCNLFYNSRKNDYTTIILFNIKMVDINFVQIHFLYIFKMSSGILFFFCRERRHRTLRSAALGAWRSSRRPARSSASSIRFFKLSRRIVGGGEDEMTSPLGVTIKSSLFLSRLSRHASPCILIFLFLRLFLLFPRAREARLLRLFLRLFLLDFLRLFLLRVILYDFLFLLKLFLRDFLLDFLGI